MHADTGNPLYANRFAAVLAFHTPPGLAPAQCSGSRTWLHIGRDGVPSSGKRFARAVGFYEGVAAVDLLDGGGWLHVTPDGRAVYAPPFRLAWAGNFASGRCTVRRRDGADYFHIDVAGVVRTGGPHAYAGDFREGAAVVRSLTDGLCRHIDVNGATLLPGVAGLFDLDVFHKSYARARDERGWFFLSRDGRDACRGKRYAAVEPFYNGQSLVQGLDGGRRVIAESGHVLVELPAPSGEAEATLQTLCTGYWAPFSLRAGLEAGTADAIAAGNVRVLPPLRSRSIDESVAIHVAVANAWCELGLARAPTSATNGAADIDEGSLGGGATPGTQYTLTARGAMLLAGTAQRERSLYWLQDRYLAAWLPGLHLQRSSHAREDELAAVGAPESAATASCTPETADGTGHRPPRDIFADLSRSSRALAESRRVLRGHAENDWRGLGVTVVERILAVSAAPPTSIVDVAGGAGTLLREVGSALPRSTRLVCFERPEVVALNAADSDPCDGVEWMAGNMFLLGTLPRAADVYLLSRVLHDWDDIEAVAVLAHVRLAAANAVNGDDAGSQRRPLLVVIDRVVTPANMHGALSLHMHMLQRARERRLDEWTALFQAGGWEAARSQQAANAVRSEGGALAAAAETAGVVAWHNDHAIFLLQPRQWPAAMNHAHEVAGKRGAACAPETTLLPSSAPAVTRTTTPSVLHLQSVDGPAARGAVGLTCVVPIGGRGTRMAPWTQAGGGLCKAMLPILQRQPSDRGHRVAPCPLVPRVALDILLRDALSEGSGVRDVVIVAASEAVQLAFARNAAFLDPLQRARIRVCVQKEPRGFGHAILCARPLITPGEPFVVALGDHVFTLRGETAGGEGAFRTLLRAYAQLPSGSALTAAGTCAADAVRVNGLLAARPPLDDVANVDGGVPALFVVDEMLEKPAADDPKLERFAIRQQRMARLRHHVGGHTTTRFVCNFGLDVLPYDMLYTLEAADATRFAPSTAELGLRESMHDIVAAGRLFGLHMHGFQRHDIGNPADYAATLLLFAGISCTISDSYPADSQ